MRRALDEYCVRGIETNLAFHRRCLRHPAFVEGDYDTGFIGRNAAELAPRADEAELDAAIIAAALESGIRAPAAPQAARGSTSNGVALSSEISGWRRQLR
jgi:acetyl/propionyl-CoA carboxylase alpha subunit